MNGPRAEKHLHRTELRFFLPHLCPPKDLPRCVLWLAVKIVEKNPKRKSHLGKKGGYDRNQWFQDEEQIYLRKKVKKKTGNYDLGFFRTVTSIHYTKERSVLESVNLGTNLGTYYIIKKILLSRVAKDIEIARREKKKK